MKNKKTTSTTLILAGIFFFLLMIISFSWVKNLSEKNREKSTVKKTVIVPTPIHLGSIKLITASQKQLFSSGEQVVVIAYADSHDIPVGGYDIVLNYNPKKARYVASKNLAPDFQTFVSEKDGAIYLTSVKNKEATASVTFKDSPLAEFTFKPVGSESMDFSIGFHQGVTTDSNLLSEDAKDILTDVEGVSVAIGDKLILQKGKEVVLADKKTSLTLVEVTPMNPRCADCMESATVVVKQGDQEKTLTFKVGGIAGMVDLAKQEFGWKFEVEKFGENTLNLQVAILEK